jgi:hypothetical protein
MPPEPSAPPLPLVPPDAAAPPVPFVPPVPLPPPVPGTPPEPLPPVPWGVLPASEDVASPEPQPIATTPQSMKMAVIVAAPLLRRARTCDVFIVCDKGGRNGKLLSPFSARPRSSKAAG